MGWDGKRECGDLLVAGTSAGSEMSLPMFEKQPNKRNSTPPLEHQLQRRTQERRERGNKRMSQRRRLLHLRLRPREVYSLLRGAPRRASRRGSRGMIKLEVRW